MDQFLMLPKFPASTPKKNNPSSVIASLLLYLFAGYWMIPDPIFLLTLVGILFLHEAGHWLAMRYYGYQDTAIFFIPFLGAMVGYCFNGEALCLFLPAIQSALRKLGG